MKEDIILIGGGGHCRACIDVIELSDKYRIVGILDKPELIGSNILGYEIIGSDDDISKLAGKVKNFIISVGQIKSPEKRIELFQKTKFLGGNFPIIISPISYISNSSFIGEGTIVMHNALINSNVKIGVNCIINSKALIEHDSIIGDHCHISTASVINGGVEIGQGSFIGSGAVSVQGARIKPGSFIRANSLFFEK